MFIYCTVSGTWSPTKTLSNNIQQCRHCVYQAFNKYRSRAWNSTVKPNCLSLKVLQYVIQTVTARFAAKLYEIDKIFFAWSYNYLCYCILQPSKKNFVTQSVSIFTRKERGWKSVACWWSNSLLDLVQIILCVKSKDTLVLYICVSYWLFIEF